jgi:ABC-2 type transport system permease protein
MGVRICGDWKSCGCPLSLFQAYFIPLEQIPQIGQFITYLSPLTYGNDLIQASFAGETHFNPVIDIVMLFVFILIFQFVANRLYVKFND